MAGVAHASASDSGPAFGPDGSESDSEAESEADCASLISRSACSLSSSASPRVSPIVASTRGSLSSRRRLPTRSLAPGGPSPPAAAASRSASCQLILG